MNGRRRWLLAWFVAALAASLIGMLALAYLNDRVSCTRAQESRRALNVAAAFVTEVAQHQRARAAGESDGPRVADLRQAAIGRRTAVRLRVPQLSCSGIIPGT